MSSTDDRLAFAPIRELGRMLRAGETTPTALTEYFLDRLDTVGRRLNAVVTLTRERALDEARVAERELRAGHDRGPLHGIPYGAKDLCATAPPYPTSWGAAPLRDQQFAHDATAIARLRAAGAVLVAKLAMVELAGGWATTSRTPPSPGRGSTPGTATPGAAGHRAGPARRSGRARCRSRSAPRRSARSSPRRRSAASPGCARPMGGSVVTARWPSAGPSTSSARWRAPPTIAASSWPRSPAATPPTRRAWTRHTPTARSATAPRLPAGGAGGRDGGCAARGRARTSARRSMRCATWRQSRRSRCPTSPTARSWRDHRRRVGERLRRVHRQRQGRGVDRAGVIGSAATAGSSCPRKTTSTPCGFAADYPPRLGRSPRALRRRSSPRQPPSSPRRSTGASATISRATGGTS